ncbi:MAG: hypothetical protein ACOCP4_05480 [Candidatus Woesearchaeota archaeon]
MVDRKRSKTDTFEILDCIPYDNFVTTGEVTKKVNQNWAMVLRRLFYLEYKGYVKFIEIDNTKKGFSGTSYAWKRLSEGEEPNQSLSKSFEGLLEYIPSDYFISTTKLGKITKSNPAVLFAKLLYLESRRKIVCFKPGPKSQINRTHYWKKLTEREKEATKKDDRKKIEKKYREECFKYTD